MLDPHAVRLIRELDPAVRRSFDAADANRIVNDPGVLPFVGLADHIDLSEIVANHQNVLLMADGGYILFVFDESGIYQVHTSFLQNCRGRHAIEASRNAYRWMFAHTDCMTLQTMVPAFNRPAALAARDIGFVPTFKRADIWPMPDGKRCDVKFYELGYATWLLADKTALIAAGQAFHQRLETEMARHGISEPQHPDDEAHDRYVGMAALMIYGGQPEKGVVLYNRWARLSGYGQIALVARSPLVIDIGNAVLMIEDQTFKVVKCRPAH